MSNQWGRGGDGPAAGGGTGMGGLLFACLVCLALGAAGGYAGLRMMGGAASSAEIEARDQRIAELARELDARVAETGNLSTQNDALRNEVEALRDSGEAADMSGVLAENTRLKQETVPKLEEELELARGRIAEAEASKASAENAARERESELSRQADEIARLEKARGEQDSALNAETRRLETEAAALRAETAEKDREIASRDARIAALEAAARPEGQDGGGAKPALDNTRPAADSRSPRNAALVAEAMRDTPGLDRLTGAERDRLESTLLSGECVTNALGGVFRRVPVLTLRNLMRDLDSDC